MGIEYRSGYKYQLAEYYLCLVAIRPAEHILTEFLCLYQGGGLLIRKGYAWDGPSGPTIDTKTFMRGSLVHDALYQLMREGHLDRDTWRETADQELRRICLEDGMCKIRAWWVYRGVRIGGGSSASPKHAKPIVTAP